MPQILMLNHAAWCNAEKVKNAQDKNEDEDADDPVVYKGKRLSQLNSDDMMGYYGDWS